jgi:hypothetical protein
MRLMPRSSFSNTLATLATHYLYAVSHASLLFQQHISNISNTLPVCVSHASLLFQQHISNISNTLPVCVSHASLPFRAGLCSQIHIAQ